MKYKDFNKKVVTDKKLDSWAEGGLNVCLIASHGVGKSSIIMSAFDRHFKHWKYFSGATCDPWTDVVGIPSSKIVDGEKIVEYIRPSDMLDNLEAIFVDEFNRAPKKVRNALLELIQFKSINGKKYPNLKCVWVAVNPPKEEDDENSFDYDVEELDPAQLDRFHVILQLPDTPSKSFFKGKFGGEGVVAVDWWKKQGKEVQYSLSPRRLDYALEMFKNGGDITDILPKTANANALVRSLSVNDEDRLFYSLKESPDPVLFEKAYQNKKFWLKYRNQVFEESVFWKCLEKLPEEEMIEACESSSDFLHYQIGLRVANPKMDKKFLEVLEKTSKIPYTQAVNLLTLKYANSDTRQIFVTKSGGADSQMIIDEICQKIHCRGALSWNSDKEVNKTMTSLTNHYLSNTAQRKVAATHLAKYSSVNFKNKKDKTMLLGICAIILGRTNASTTFAKGVKFKRVKDLAASLVSNKELEEIKASNQVIGHEIENAVNKHNIAFVGHGVAPEGNGVSADFKKEFETALALVDA